MQETVDRNRILKEIALQIEAEMDRGISFWAEPAFNEAASEAARAEPTFNEATGAATPRPAAGSQARPHVAAATKRRPAFGPPPMATDRDADWERRLEELRQETLECTRCPLHKTRTNVVFNSGNGKVPLVFVSEAPGAREDAQGEAFVGRAGELLTKIIAAIGIDRKDVYICNVLKCRPPDNRNPTPDEIAACSPFLIKQLDILKPRVICTLGLFATQLLLEMKAPIGKLRGRLFRYRGIPLLPTYHPAALLRNPGLKRILWKDVQLLRRVLDEGPEKAGIEVQKTGKGLEGPPRPVSGNLF